ncbi:MAG: helix-turn-helix domain-containing protein [Frankia sp.]
MPLLRRLVGQALRRHRLTQGRTLRNVAEAARVSLPYLSEVERGLKEASSEILAAICRALKVRLSDLLDEVRLELARVEPAAPATPSVPLPALGARAVPTVQARAGALFGDTASVLPVVRGSVSTGRVVVRAVGADGPTSTVRGSRAASVWIVWTGATSPTWSTGRRPVVTSSTGTRSTGTRSRHPGQGRPILVPKVSRRPGRIQARLDGPGHVNRRALRAEHPIAPVGHRLAG